MGTFVVLFFIYYVDAYSINFPFQDDNSLLQIILEVEKGLGWKHDLYVFFRPENDHRLFIPRLISYLDYRLTGHPNFKLFIFIATANLLLVVGFIFRLFRQLRLPLYYFLPIPLLLFHPQYHEVSIWALTGLQHTTLFLLLSFTLILLKKPTAVKTGMAIVLATLATFTHGNGILVFATGVFRLLLEKNYKTLVPWGLFMLMALLFYLAGYTPGSGVKSTINWAYLPASFVVRIGASLSVFHKVAIGASIVWGTLISVLVIPAMIKRLGDSFKKRAAVDSVRNELYSFFCFIFLTIALITVFRASSELVQENRFKIYAAFSSLLLYLFLLLHFPSFRKGILVLFTVLAALVYVNSYTLYTPEVVHKHSRLVADTYNWPKHQIELCNFSSVEKSLYFLVPVYQQGYWQVPTLFNGLDGLIQNAVQRQDFKPYPFQTARFLHDGDGHPQLSFAIQDLPFQRHHLHDNLLLILHNEANQQTYLVGTSPKFAGWRRFFTKGMLFDDGLSAVLPIQVMPPGQYRLGCLLTRPGERSELMLSQQTVRF